MASTTIRVDTETHAKLLALSAARGTPLIDTVRDAAEALRRQRFAELVTHQLDELRSDPARWAAYLADAESTHVDDGVG